MHTHTNKLIDETSPYLLQHAHNPVDWYPWGNEALERAKKEDKPILVSIGYSACHWCHVMEKESFEDVATASYMNEHFINIKIDREERPDLDQIYMDAVQAISGSGGWPLNVFLTPDAKPFFGGTYFPPRQAFNRASWMDVLNSINSAFHEKRDEINAQAENLTDHLLQSNAFAIALPAQPKDQFKMINLDAAVSTILQSADKVWGGFGQTPKFPQTFTIQFLLRYAAVKFSRHRIPEIPEPEPEDQAGHAYKQALLSLDKMIDGGIYDQVGGGFARYSTDREWLVPHFEKMLYDNALLVSVLSDAYALTGIEKYRKTIAETLAFVERELRHEQGGFYAALDADSEGVEGKFYVWKKEEVDELLGANAALFCNYFGITEKGNWEGTNILYTSQSIHDFARQEGMQVEALEALIDESLKKVLNERSRRVRPALDDKVILGWNALMNTAYSKAYAATGVEAYRQTAIDNMNFLLKNFSIGEGEELLHTWKAGKARFPAFLDDYAFLVQALIHLQEITGDKQWLSRAEAISLFVIKTFGEEDQPFFYYTKSGQEDVIVRKIEVYDAAIPSGNSLMANNLYRLSLFCDRPEWKLRSLEMSNSMSKLTLRYPSSFGNWACMLLEIATGTHEIAILGKDPWVLHKRLLELYIPNRILMVSETADNSPLLKDKPVTEKTNIWLCRDYSCQLPVSTIDELTSLINREQAV